MLRMPSRNTARTPRSGFRVRDELRGSWGQTGAFATALEERGIGEDDRIALYLPNLPQFVISFHGTLRAGGVVVPMNPQYKDPRDRPPARGQRGQGGGRHWPTSSPSSTRSGRHERRTRRQRRRRRRRCDRVSGTSSSRVIPESPTVTTTTTRSNPTRPGRPASRRASSSPTTNRVDARTPPRSSSPTGSVPTTRAWRPPAVPHLRDDRHDERGAVQRRRLLPDGLVGRTGGHLADRGRGADDHARGAGDVQRRHQSARRRGVRHVVAAALRRRRFGHPRRGPPTVRGALRAEDLRGVRSDRDQPDHPLQQPDRGPASRQHREDRPRRRLEGRRRRLRRGRPGRGGGRSTKRRPTSTRSPARSSSPART